MQEQIFWTNLKNAFGNQKIFWTPEELAEKPGVTDRLLHYLISYFDNPAVARKAIRVFRGITTDGKDQFSGWNEVRVASLREISDALIFAGCKSDAWELAIYIKDFLFNAWQTLCTVDLTDVPQADAESITPYLKQLRGIPNSWEVVNDKGKKSLSPIPIRNSNCNFYKHFLKYRRIEDQVLPDCVIDYLEYLWNRTKHAPFENHANRILSRVGIFDNEDSISNKFIKFESFLTTNAPVTNHKNLVQLGKVVCISKNPRCNVCPVSNQCSRIGISE